MRKQPLPHRRHAEILEPRRLLDGNVQVTSHGSSLSVSGDQLANGLLIEHLGPASPPGATGKDQVFLITPDATTRINGGAPGAKLQVTAPASDLAINLGAGNDRLTFLGAEEHSLRSLRCVTSAGDDRLELVDFSFEGDVRCTNTSGEDDVLLLHGEVGGLLYLSNRNLSRVQFEDVLVYRGTDKASPALALSLRNANVEGDAVTVEGDARITFDNAGGRVSLHKGSIDGTLDVTSSGPLAFDGVALRSADMFLKMPAARADMTDADASSVRLLDCDIDGDLTVLGGLLHLDMRSTDAGGAAYLKVTLSDLLVSSYSLHGGDVSITDSSFGQGLDVSSDLPLTVSVHGGGDDRPMESLSLNFTKVEFKYMPDKPDAPRHSSVSLRDLHVAGDVTVSGNESLAVELARVTGDDLRFQFPAARVDSPPDLAGSLVLTDCVVAGDLTMTGGSPLRVAMKGTRTGGQAYFAYELENVLVSSYSVHGGALDITDATFGDGLRVVSDLPLRVSYHGGGGGGGSGGDVPTESVSLNFTKVEFKYAPNSPNARRGSSIDLHGVRVAEDIRVVGNQDLDVSLEHFEAGGVVVVLDGVDPASQPGGVRVAAGDVNGDGRCDIITAGPSSVSLTGLRAADVYLKLGDLPGVADDGPESRAVTISDLTMDGRLDVVSTASAKVQLRDVFGNAAYIKLGDIKGEAAAKHKDWIEILSMRLSGDLSVSTEGPTEVAVQQARAADFFLKLDGIKGSSAEPSSHVVLRDVSLSSDAVLTIDAPTDVTVRGMTADDLTVHMTDRALRTGEPPSAMMDLDVVSARLAGRVLLDMDAGARVSLADCVVFEDLLVTSNAQRTVAFPHVLEVSGRSLQVGGSLEVFADASTDVSLASSRIDGGVAIKVGGESAVPPGQVGDPAALSFAATDVALGDALVVHSRGGHDAVLLERCGFLDPDNDDDGLLDVALGRGDDMLQCIDCAFDGLAVLLGGTGSDTLLLDNVTLGRRIVRGWENVTETPADPGGVT